MIHRDDDLTIVVSADNLQDAVYESHTAEDGIGDRFAHTGVIVNDSDGDIIDALNRPLTRSPHEHKERFHIQLSIEIE